MSKMKYKAVGLLVGLLGGMLASAIVRKVWELTPGHDEAPEAIDTRRSWAEILTAAALQGAIFAVIRAAIERATAASAEKLAGAQPGHEVKRQQGGDGRDEVTGGSRHPRAMNSVQQERVALD
jgi:uncharacterized protein DUF4235